MNNSNTVNKGCNSCTKRFLNYKNYLFCSSCKYFSHSKCNGITKTEASIILANKQLHERWTCKPCTRTLCTSTTEPKLAPSIFSPLATTCYVCTNPIGKRLSNCTLCNNTVHPKCNNGSLGCSTCRDSIFPLETDLLTDCSMKTENLLFNPYDPSTSNNLIGNTDFELNTCELMETLSQNLKNCRYTNLKNFKTKTNELSILSLNIRSLKTNHHKLQDLEDELSKFDIICLQETGIDPSLIFNKNFYDLNGFHPPLLQKPVRESSKGGGLAIYANKSSFEEDSLRELTSLSDSTVIENGEFLLAEISTGPKHKNIIIGNFYRSPSAKPDSFCAKLNNVVHDLLHKHSKKRIILTGDANIDLLKHDNYPQAATLINNLSQNGFISVIARPTHISDKYATLIDHIYTNNVECFLSSGIITNPISDHLGTYIRLAHKPMLTQTSDSYNYTDMSPEILDAFGQTLHDADWTHALSSENPDPDGMFTAFHDVFDKHHSTHFPITKKKLNDRKDGGKPWMQPWLKEACDRKNKLYDDYVKKPSPKNKTLYHKMKKLVDKYVYKNKKRYYSGQIEQYNMDSRKQWKIINQVISNRKSGIKIKKLVNADKVITDNTQIAETFNTYFVSIAEKLKNQIDPPNHISCKIPTVPNSIFIEPCTPFEINDIIKKLRNSSTSDYKTQIIKHVSSTLSEVLCPIINASLLHGVFPSLLKTAKVVPIHKSGKKHDVANFRPISLLSTFSKIYEKVMYQRLSSFFQINSIINSRQYGFRPQHSCEHALLDAKNTILGALHRKQIALLLLIDFSKAFDMVDHTILLGKLSKYGIRGPALQWISSYLHDRTQYVSVNGAISSTMHLKYGVPQGSILGPLLFIIYINDLPRIAPLIHFIMYADDANIIIIGNSMAETQAKANELLKLLANWVSANALKLNVGKTHYMVFSNTNTVTINLELNGSVIHQSHHERFLGVIIDDKLSWKYHHMALANKISINAGLFFRARHMFKIETLKKLYFSFIQSHLTFCPSIWGLGSKNSINSIFIAQKKAIRALTFTNLYVKNKETNEYSYGHTKALFNANGLLTIHNLILTQALAQLHKVYIHQAPNHTIQIFSPCNPPSMKNKDRTSYHPEPNPDTAALLRRGVDTMNIILNENTLYGDSMTYFAEPEIRLASQRKSLFHKGPLAYNTFGNTIQERLAASNSKLKAHKLTPKTFTSHVKTILLEHQAIGEPDSWDTRNMPLYLLTTGHTMQLRNRSTHPS